MVCNRCLIIHYKKAAYLCWQLVSWAMAVSSVAVCWWLFSGVGAPASDVRSLADSSVLTEESHFEAWGIPSCRSWFWHLVIWFYMCHLACLQVLLGQLPVSALSGQTIEASKLSAVCCPVLTLQLRNVHSLLSDKLWQIFFLLAGLRCWSSW